MFAKAAVIPTSSAVVRVLRTILKDLPVKVIPFGEVVVLQEPLCPVEAEELTAQVQECHKCREAAADRLPPLQGSTQIKVEAVRAVVALVDVVSPGGEEVPWVEEQEVDVEAVEEEVEARETIGGIDHIKNCDLLSWISVGLGVF